MQKPCDECACQSQPCHCSQLGEYEAYYQGWNAAANKVLDLASKKAMSTEVGNFIHINELRLIVERLNTKEV